jgi:hypothetical protein
MTATDAVTPLVQVIIIVAAGLLVVAIPFALKAFRRLFNDVHDLKVAVAGDPKYGVPGLINTVRDLSDKMSLNLSGTTALIKDSKPDEGSSSRDALNRIEANQQKET